MQYHLFTDYYYMMFGEMVNFYRSLLSERLVASMIILAVGIIFALELGKLTKKIVQKAGIDKALENTGAKNFLKKGGIKFSFSDLLGWFVKWFIIIFALMASVDYLNMPQASKFLSDILGYLPNLVSALAVLTIGIIVAQMVYEAINSAGMATGAAAYRLTALVAKWILLVVTVLVALEQFGIGMSMLTIFASGLSLMIAIAGGLAFGLGGQNHARELLDGIKNRITRHQ